LTEAPKKIQVALLIDRRHKLFPIHADFVGLSLATTIQEHIEVVMNEAEESAYLQ
jgi:pyrimidine operon attenuation protein/uracil phosphoribosyltransferase